MHKHLQMCGNGLDSPWRLFLNGWFSRYIWSSNVDGSRGYFGFHKLSSWCFGILDLGKWRCPREFGTSRSSPRLTLDQKRGSNSSFPSNNFLYILSFYYFTQQIVAFGGDSDRITLFGSGAGGQSVLFQMMAPQNIGQALFQRVISQSGSPVEDKHLDFPRSRRSYALELASSLGCKAKAEVKKFLYSAILKHER